MATREVNPLKCAICLECYKTPKFLPCFHSFCAPCLQGYIDKHAIDRKINCPLCRERCSVPKSGVDEFVTNFYIEALETCSIHENVSCDICGPDVFAEKTCIDCDENFCTRCGVTHSKSKLTKDHELRSITGTIQGGKSATSRFYCSKHPEVEVRVICDECEKKPQKVPIKEYNVQHVRDIKFPVNKEVWGIAPVENNRVWILFYGHPDVFLIDNSGKVLQSVSVGENCDFGSGDGYGNFLVACFSAKVIKRVKPNGSVETLVSGVEDLCGIAGRRKGDHGDIFCSCKLDGKYCIARVKTQGQTGISKILEIDGGVRRLAADRNSDFICASTGSDTVIILQSDGNVVSTFKRGGKDCSPYGLYFDHNGCIVFADNSQKSVLRISKEPELIQTLVDGLSGDMDAVAIADDNNLWLGRPGGEIKIYKLS